MSSGVPTSELQIRVDHLRRVIATTACSRTLVALHVKLEEVQGALQRQDADVASVQHDKPISPLHARVTKDDKWLGYHAAIRRHVMLSE